MRHFFVVTIAAGILESGCVVRDIRDDLRTANSQLAEVDQSLSRLETTNQSLSTTNVELAKVNQRLAAVEQGLSRVDATNQSLEQLNAQMGALKSIEASLSRLDQHLSSLRTSIARLDSVVPFLDLGSGDLPALPLPPAPSAVMDAAPAAETRKPEAAGAGERREGQEPGARNATAAERREPLIGSWVSQYPTRDTALVVMADGRFILLNRAGAERVEGTWARADARTVRLTSGSAARADGQPQTGPIDLLMRAQIGRSMTVDLGGQTVIFVRQ